jgi:hypothetical protein
LKQLYGKGDKSECVNYQDIGVFSVGSKLLSNTTLFKLKDAEDKRIIEEQWIFRKGRGRVD